VSRDFPEKDWRVFRELDPVWVERYCVGVNREVISKLSDTKRTEHERYIEVYRFIQRKDAELGAAFNDFRRSTAIRQISVIRSLRVVAEQEVARFSEQTQRFSSEWGFSDRPLTIPFATAVVIMLYSGTRDAKASNWLFHLSVLLLRLAGLRSVAV
jgi:hypothetical protein